MDVKETNQIIVTSPVTLSDNQKKLIVQFIQSKQSVPLIKYQIDPTLLGGFKIKARDWVVDMTLSNQIRETAKYLKA